MAYINNLELPTSNLSRNQEQLLEWHRRLGHLDFRCVQDLARARHLPSNIANCPIPKCADCQLGKQTRRSAHGKPGSVISDKLEPGNSIHMDQMISPHPGHPFKGGKTSSYTVMTVFVDAASQITKVFFQRTTSAEETILSKIRFETWSASHGIRIKHYHGDNGIFNSHEWRTHCDTNAQTYSFCGVSAHHQNPLAENAIRRITNRARTAMMTTTLHWDLLSTLTNFNLQDFWPFACYTFAELDNDLPRSQQQHSPLSIFSKTSQSFHLRNFHVWGCPVYVLDPKLADGKTLPRWEPRSRLGLYLGPSPLHSTSVALVLNLKTRRISPQYHVVFDDRFHTVNPNQRELSTLWDQLYSSNCEVYAEPSEFPPHEPIPYEWTDATPDSSVTAPVDSASIPASPAPSGPPSPPPPSVASPLAPPAPSTPSSSSSPSSPSAPASPLPQKQVRFQRESATPTNLSSDLFAETPSDSSRN